MRAPNSMTVGVRKSRKRPRRWTSGSVCAIPTVPFRRCSTKASSLRTTGTAISGMSSNPVGTNNRLITPTDRIPRLAQAISPLSGFLARGLLERPERPHHPPTDAAGTDQEHQRDQGLDPDPEPRRHGIEERVDLRFELGAKRR